MKTPLQTTLLEKLQLRLPIIQGPMNNASTPAMAAAVSNAGGLGSLAISLLEPDAILQSAVRLRELTAKAFNLNLFVLAPPQPDPQALARATTLLAPIRQELGLPEAAPLQKYGENFVEQFEALLLARPAVASFTFGIVSATQIERLHRIDSLVIGTATNVAEALAWQEVGADFICAQGAEAGGHRGTFIGSFESSMIGCMALVPQIVDAVRLPVIAAGGIMDGRGIAASLMLGAQAAQLGSAFLSCAETAIPASWQAALRTTTDTATRTTRAFSGRPARGIHNQFMQRMAAHEAAFPDYPVQNALTTEIRRAAAQTGQADYLSLWAGQAAGMSRKRQPGIRTAELMAQLEGELVRALHMPANFTS